MEKITIPSESNLRKIINILVGLMDDQEILEQQCVLPYVSDGSKVYTNPMLTIYNNGTTYGLYMCKYSTSGTWNPNAWIEICSSDALKTEDVETSAIDFTKDPWE